MVSLCTSTLNVGTLWLVGSDTMGNGYYESALLRLRRVTAYLNSRYGDVFTEHDITPVQFEILLFVESNTPCSVSAVAEFMLVDKSTSSRVLKGIQDKGLIDVGLDTADRRRRQVRLTPAGLNAVMLYKTAWLEVERNVKAQYNEAIEHLERF